MGGFLGAGAAPAGSTPAGYGTPATGGAINLPAQPTTPAIDPALRDYTYDASGNRVQATIAQQQVVIACLTVLDSSAVAGQGLAPQPKILTAAYVETRKIDYANAFATMIAGGVAELVSVQVDRIKTASGTSRVTETVRWRDLTTGLEMVSNF